MPQLSYLLSLSILCSLVLAQSCFHPNGTQTTAQDKGRCSDNPSSPIYNVCCATERDVPYGGELVGNNYTIDRCLSNGLCQNKITTKEYPDGLTSYFREECTLFDWTKGNCPMFCLDDTGAGNVQMTPCEDGNPNSEFWCCGASRDCCGKAGQVKVAATLGATATPSTSSVSSSSTSTSTSFSSTSSASSTATPTPSHTPSSSPAPSTSTGLSGGAKAGIAIGAVAGVLAVFGAGYLLARRRKKQVEVSYPYGNVSEMEHDNTAYHNTQGYAPPADRGTTKYRMEEAPPQEMPAQIPAQELPANR